MKARIYRYNGRNTTAARQRGQGMTEYIIITALIAIAAIAAVTYFGGAVRSQVSGMSKELAGQSATSSISDASDHAQAAKEESEKTKTLATYDNVTATSK